MFNILTPLALFHSFYYVYGIQIQRLVENTMKSFILLITFLFISASSVEAQDTLPFSGKTYYNWYFGSNAGITFNTPNKEPKLLIDNLLSENGNQNASTISDRQGNFLFHTDGELLVNLKHKIINRDMGGNVSQSEGSVLAPLNDNKFIFFTTVFANNVVNADQFDPPRNLNDTTGLIYSIFTYDYDADTIIFEVYKKQLNENYRSEAIQLSYSAITGNYILIGYEAKGELSVYEFDLYGNYLRQNSQHYHMSDLNTNLLEIRINQMCDRIAISSSYRKYRVGIEERDSIENSFIYSMSFDAEKLEFYNHKKIDMGRLHLFSIEFSSNSNYIYALLRNLGLFRTNKDFLVRYDFRKSEFEPIYEERWSEYYHKSLMELRIAPNNKIYIIRSFSDYLSSIQNPDSELDSDFKRKAVDLKIFDDITRLSIFDSPKFIAASFAPVYVRSEVVICEGKQLELFAKTQIPDTNAIYRWIDPNNNISEVQNLIIDNIQLDQAGLYKAIVQRGEQIDTAESFVFVKPSPESELRVFPKTFICGEGAITISPFEDYEKYLWTTGDTTKYISVTKSGTYGVTVTNELDCETYIEVNVGFGRDYVVAIEGDNLKCIGDQVTLTCRDEFQEYKWSTGDTTKSITVTTPAKYTLTIKTEDGCTISRTIEVKDYPKVNSQINTTATTICRGDSTLLESRYDVPYYSYEWNTGATTKSIYVNSSGTYKLTITDIRTGCIDSTEIAIKVEDNLKPEIIGKNICSGQSATLTALPNDPSYTYLWSNGESTPVIVVNQAGTYTVTVSKAGCVGTAEFTVKESPTPEFEILGENIICNNETASLSSSEDFAEYHWSTNEITKEIEVTEAGTYTLTVTDENGCTATESFEVEKYELSFDISKGSIDFGKVYITENPMDSVVIINTSGFDVVMDLGQPTMLLDGQSFKLKKTLKPESLGTYTDSYSLHITEPCDTVITIPITARVYARTTISTEDIYTQIGQTETVPVYLECEADLPTQDYSITTDIDRTAFFTNDSYTINQTQPISKNRTNIHNLTGTILLSSSLEYDITFPSYSFTNPYIEVVEQPGIIYIDSVCVFNFRDIQLIDPTTLDISPNPASEQLNIDITTGVQGTMKLELVATDGRVIYSDEWTQSTKTKQMQINTLAIPSGLYQVRLITPYDAITKSVVVVE